MWDSLAHPNETFDPSIPGWLYRGEYGEWTYWVCIITFNARFTISGELELSVRTVHVMGNHVRQQQPNG